MLKKILCLLALYLTTQLTLKAESTVRESDEGDFGSVVRFARLTYICGPAKVLSKDEFNIIILMLPTFDGCSDIKTLWDRELRDVQVEIEAYSQTLSAINELHPGSEQLFKSYKYLCVDIVAFDSDNDVKLYGTGYRIYK